MFVLALSFAQISVRQLKANLPGQGGVQGVLTEYGSFQWLCPVVLLTAAENVQTPLVATGIPAAHAAERAVADTERY